MLPRHAPLRRTGTAILAGLLFAFACGDESEPANGDTRKRDAAPADGPRGREPDAPAADDDDHGDDDDANGDTPSVVVEVPSLGARDSGTDTDDDIADDDDSMSVDDDGADDDGASADDDVSFDLDASIMDAGLDAGSPDASLADASLPDASSGEDDAGSGAPAQGGSGGTNAGGGPGMAGSNAGGSGGSSTGGAGTGGGGNAGSGNAGNGNAGNGNAGAGNGGTGGARPCDGECGTDDPVLGAQPRLCCDDQCVNPYNDPNNCGECGKECGPNQICRDGGCITRPCQTICVIGQCCGADCCTGGEICCESMGPIAGTRCMSPNAAGTCPVGCAPLCECLSPGTGIATARGEVPIEDLAVGDLVYSVHDEAIVLVPLLQAESRPVEGHHVSRLSLSDGTVLEVSEGHPMGDGTSFGSLSVGDMRGSLTVMAIERIPYQHGFTFDILPDSSTGTYFAGGMLMGSTLFEP